MKHLRILGVISLVAVMSIASSAYADIMTATWTGNAYSTNQGFVGPAVATFTYDTNTLSPLTPNNGYDEETYPDFGNMYSAATISLNGAPAIDIGSPGDISSSSLVVGDSTQYYKDYYLNYVYDSSSGIQLNFSLQDEVGGITSLDLTYAFSVSASQFLSNIPFARGLYVDYMTGDYYTVYMDGLTVVDEGPSPPLPANVPTPDALALFGLGLIGIGGLRRKVGGAW